MNNGDRVQWREGGAQQFTCHGRIICNLTNNGKPTHWYSIVVDPGDSYNRACHTASEMHLGWVDRSIDIHNLRSE